MNFLHRNMIQHMLTVLRSTDWPGHLVVNVDFDPAELALLDGGFVPSGRCGHLTDSTGPNEIPVFKLGCSGNQKIPAWLFRDSDSFSGGLEGEDVAVVNYPTYSGGGYRRLLAFVGLEGFELATTEANHNRSYKVGQYLRAPQIGESGQANASIDANTIAGIATNETVRHGVETIVGIVSPGTASPMAKTPGVDEYGNKVLTLYTTYRPPVQGVRTGVPVNVANGLGAA